MRIRQFAVQLFAIVIVFCGYVGNAQPTARTTGGVRGPHPSGPHQIVGPTTLEGCLTTYADQKDARAWCLFKALLTTGTNGDPVWVDWYAKPSNGLGSFNCNQAASFTRVRQAELLSPAAKRSREIHEITLPTQIRAVSGDPNFRSHDRAVAVGSQNHYNQAMVNALCGFTGTKPLSQAISGAGSSVVLPSQQAEVIVKTAFAVAYKQAGTAYQINVWVDQDLAGYRPTEQPVQNPYNGWTTTVQPVPGGSCPTTPVSYTASTFQYRVPQISLNCFYSFPVESQQDIQYLEGQTLMPVVGPTGSAYLILLGFNVMARLPGQAWTWQTYWWSGAQRELDTAGRTAPNPNPLLNNSHYSQFVMTSGQGNVYNPYLEAVLPGGKKSDCQRCHGHAMYPLGSAAQAQTTFDSILACQLGSRAPCPAASQGLKTDDIWSVADVNIHGAVGAVQFGPHPR